MGRAFRDLIDTAVDLLHLFILRRTDQIKHLCIGLHHIGGIAAGVCDGVMDPGLGDHMLPEELNAHVH